MAGASRWYHYCVYGISLRSEIPLGCPECSRNVGSAVAIVNASEAFFRKVLNGASLRTTKAGFQYGCLHDGSTYLRWKDLSEFLVSADGSRVTCCPVDQASSESVHIYLLAQVLSFALLKKGIEPLHATVVAVNGEAIGFLGDSGHGKSTLAASFLQLGHRMLTDDLLVARQQRETLWAYPGPARIKLFPGTARRLLGHSVTGFPMNRGTRKLVIALSEHQIQNASVPLRALYVLDARTRASQGQSVRIRKLSHRDAFVELVKNTFNGVVVDSWRLQQQFAVAALRASSVPVKVLLYSRTLAGLPTVRDAILADLVSMPDNLRLKAPGKIQATLT